MIKVAKFEKVSFEEFSKEINDIKCYEEIILPKRATIGSAGYDFYAPFDFTLVPEYFEKFGKVVSNQLVARGTKHIYLVKSNIDKDTLLANAKWQKVSKYK